jgi:prephenate dehydrogenase
VKSLTRAAELSDIVVIATPTQTTNEIFNEIAPKTPRRTLLVEISSTKEPVRRMIQNLARRGVQVLSIHPMFGPSAKTLTDKAIIVAQEPQRSQPANAFLSKFRKKGAKIIRSNLKDHDRIVAATLTLPHLVNFAFMETLQRAGYPLDMVRKIGGTTFKLQLLLAEALYHESLDNETSILTDNKYAVETLRTFSHQVDAIRATIHEGSKRKLMNRLRSDAAYVRGDTMFRTAYDRFATAVEASTHT